MKITRLEDIKSILFDLAELKKAYDNINDSILILEQIKYNINPNEYAGEKFSLEEGNKIIVEFLRINTNPRITKVISRNKDIWNDHYDDIKNKIYSRN